MRRSIAFYSLLLCGALAAEQDVVSDPFAVAAAARAVPEQIRVSLQWIEMPQPMLTELLSADDTCGNMLHAKAIAAVKEGKAKIVETSMVTGQSGKKLTIESLREEIYPTEYEPPGLPGGGTVGRDILKKSPTPGPTRYGRKPTAFQTRNTGSTLTLEPALSVDGKSIALNISTELAARIRNDTHSAYRDEWGDASIRMPVYETKRADTVITVVRGKVELVTVIHPKPLGPSPALSPRILVFVRADVIALPK